MLEVCCRGKGKVDGVQTDDEEIRSDLETIQPPAIDTRATISPEEVTSLPGLPRGVCTGTLIPGDNTATTTTGQPTTTGQTTGKALLLIRRYYQIEFLQGFICPADQSSNTFTIGTGDSLTYSTQEGPKYTRNVDCTVKFRKGSSCKKLRFSCESFLLAKGDTMFVKRGKKTLRFVVVVLNTLMDH